MLKNILSILGLSEFYPSLKSHGYTYQSLSQALTSPTAGSLIALLSLIPNSALGLLLYTFNPYSTPSQILSKSTHLASLLSIPSSSPTPISPPSHSLTPTQITCFISQLNHSHAFSPIAPLVYACKCQDTCEAVVEFERDLGMQEGFIDQEVYRCKEFKNEHPEISGGVDGERVFLGRKNRKVETVDRRKEMEAIKAVLKNPQMKFLISEMMARSNSVKYIHKKVQRFAEKFGHEVIKFPFHEFEMEFHKHFTYHNEPTAFMFKKGMEEKHYVKEKAILENVIEMDKHDESVFKISNDDTCKQLRLMFPRSVILTSSPKQENLLFLFKPILPTTVVSIH
jgi:hypothetical protein